MVMKQLNSLNSFVIVISLISHNFVPFYWIQVGFSLKSIVLITEHFYTLCEIDFQILNFGAKFEWHLWRHIVNHKCDATTTECGFPQTMFLPSFATFSQVSLHIQTSVNQVEKKHPFLTIVIRPCLSAIVCMDRERSRPCQMQRLRS